MKNLERLKILPAMLVVMLSVLAASAQQPSQPKTSAESSLKSGTDAAAFQKKCAHDILEGLEVAPSRVDVLPGAKMSELLGMETEMKEKRFIDTRPK